MWQKIKNYYHLAQALISAIYFQFPSKSLIVIGVTGTDGKTTTVNMIYHILKSCGKKASMISSVSATIGEKSYQTGFHVSTPSSFDVQKYLKKSLDAGCEYFVMESTSHGLDQNRLAFINFTTGVLTNITHEHLDYHKTRKHYVQSKLKLFKNSQKSVLNKEDASFSEIKNQINGKIITYSQKGSSDFNLKNSPVSLNIPGNYNLLNGLAAVAAATSVGIPKSQAQKALKSFPGVRGRMEEIDEGQDFDVFVDFAHTPNGLEQAMKALSSKLIVDPLRKRSEASGSQLIVVFGAAGERDKSKRALMGSVANKYASRIILTSEDPRSEDPEKICTEIAKGIKGKKYQIITNRQEAINYAIQVAKTPDTVAIFGKGHETSMNINGKELPWSDFDAVEKALKALDEK